MKNLLTFYCLIISFCAFAQAPQGFTYQAVATDNNGLELVEQNVSVRVSILSESSTGVEQWIETHSTTTDGFGLFTITIGEGTSTGNGAQSAFSDIDWGGSEHHLKIEMDVDGGSEYQLLGISQLMSVPYALYAESSGTAGPEGPEGPPGEPAAPVDYDSLATIISADSSFTANFSGGIGGGGCNMLYPDGINGVALTVNVPFNGTYTVPSGKRFYITQKYSGSDNLSINGITINNYDGDFNLVIANPGDILGASGGLSGTVNLNGYLVNSTADVEGLTVNVPFNGTYTVPSGKRFYITQKYSGSDNLSINGITINNYDGDFNLVIANPGDILGASGGLSGIVNLNGYLVDENYFANCGGGSSSSATTNNQINNYNNILNQSVTSGTFNYLYASFPTNSSFNYTVPAGKIMKITDANLTNFGNNNPTYINGQLWHLSANLPTLISEGTQIEIQFSANDGDAVAIQYDLIDNTQGIILNYLYASFPTNSSFNYTVPAGKIMKITDANLTNFGNNNPTYINGQLWHLSANLPTLISEGTQIEIQFSANDGDAVAIQYILFDI